MRAQIQARLQPRLLQLRAQLGTTGLLACGLILLAFAANVALLKPLDARKAALESALARHAPKAPGQPAATGEKLASFYEFLVREEAPTDWLAKLHAISRATGVELQTASYRAQPAANGSRIERYEIVMPVTGTYPQLRDFLGRALAEVPILSLDQLSLKRENRNEGEVHAELRMTLHMAKR